MSTQRHAFIIGASRGIGLGLVQQFLANDWQVTATVRQTDSLPTALQALKSQHGDELHIESLDLENLSFVQSSQQTKSIDVLLISAGILGPDHQQAEQVRDDELAQLFTINAIAPIRIARHYLQHVKPGGTIAFMTSLMGSVALNETGDNELYRASKAALNSLTRGFAQVEALPAGVGVLNLHPGWVKTDMGGEQAPVTVEQSTQGLYAVIDASLGQTTQQFIDFSGKKLSW